MRHAIVISTEDALRVARFLRPGMGGSEEERAACRELRQRMRALIARNERIDMEASARDAAPVIVDEREQDWQVTTAVFNIEWIERPQVTAE